MPLPANTQSAASAGALPTTMTAVTARTYGGPEVLTIEQVPVPSPQTGELLVEVRASSLNALDWHFLTGTPYVARAAFGLRRPKRIVRGADVAGVVVAVGEGVTQFQVGDSVFGEAGGGGCGEYLTVRETSVVAIPDGVSFEAAAATPVAGLTALQGLRTHGAVAPGDRVLINGAAGGVGTMAVQVAKALGAHVTAVCSTRNVDMVRALGADEVIDYTRDDFVTGTRTATGTGAGTGAGTGTGTGTRNVEPNASPDERSAPHFGQGEGGGGGGGQGDGSAEVTRFDVMLDNVGNRRPKECRSVLVEGGRYVAVSGPKANRWVDPLPYLVRARLAFLRSPASFHQFTASPEADDLAFLGELLASRRLVPEIDRLVGFDGVADGLAEIGSGHARAKIVVVPSR